MLTELGAMAHEAVRGWSGLGLEFASVEVPMLAALARGRAEWRAFVASPMVAGMLMVATGITLSVASPALHAMHAAGGGVMEYAVGAGIGGLLGYGGGKVLSTPNRHDEGHIRGTTILDAEQAGVDRDARRERGRARGRAAREHRSGITLAGVPVAAADETKHFKLMGTTGAGKSTAIAELLSGALRRGDRAIIADPDGGYLARFFEARRGDVILSPFEPGGAKWDLFGEIREEYDIDQLALALIPDHEGQDRSWRGYARTLFSAVTSQARAGGVSDVKQLFELLVTSRKGELQVLTGGTPAQAFFEEHNDRMLDSIRSVLTSGVGALQHVARQESQPLSVRQWVRSGRGVLFIPYRAGQIAALRSTISAWMRIGIFEAMSQPPGDQRLWFVVDELDALGQIDGLKDALARLRKFGGRCVLGFQSVAQVSSTYGRGEAQTIVENCGNSLILRCSASEHGGTSQFASRLIGQREVVHVSRSTSRRPGEFRASVTEAQHRQIEPAVMDSEIERLADLSGFLKLASSPDWLRVRLRPPERIREASAANAASAAWSAAHHESPLHRADTSVTTAYQEGWEHD
ncbi:MAG TPA: type IV secretion system DNA-binding domain-containing protein [Steroidobacteraceae bacterium]|nr:type IV secretion system DNA-binding domain-containing protein [Steroidobacteraceae bacterium]